MARPTKLRLLGDRPAPTHDDPDIPAVIAFPAVDQPIDPQTENDVLAILRRERERMGQQIEEAGSAATQALNAASGLQERVAQVESRTQTVADAAMTALKEVGSASKVAARERMALATALLQRLAAYAIDRAAALLSLAGAFVLFQGILPDPHPLQLWALGLYGATVIGPAVWLSARKAQG